MGIFNIFWKDVNGALWAIGYNGYGQLCQDTPDRYTPTPVQIPINDVQVVDGGRYHTVFLKDGVAYGCGDGTYGELGNASTTANNTTPLPLSSSLGDIVDIATA